MLNDSLPLTFIENMITGFDFHPGGELMATEDMDNTYLISDVNTNDYRFHVNSGTNRGTMLENYDFEHSNFFNVFLFCYHWN